MMPLSSNPKRKKMVSVLVFCWLLLSPLGFAVSAAGSPSITTSTSVIPDFTFQIPIGTTTSISGADITSGKAIAFYINTFYPWLVAFAAVLAVLAFTYAGVLWLIAGGDAGKVTESKKVMGSALIGLLLALGSYTFLAMLGSDFVNFKPIRVKPITPIALSLEAIDAARITDPSDPNYEKQFTVAPNLKDLNPDIKYSATAQDVLSRVKGHHYLTAGNEQSLTTGAITGFSSYRNDLLTLVHENVHNINAGHDITNSCDGQALYFGGGKFDCVPDGNLATKDAIPFIPDVFKNLDNASYPLQFFGIGANPGRADQPISSVLDEQSANTIELKVATDLAKAGRADKAEGFRYNPIVRIIPYTLAVALAVEKKDPEYLRSHPGFKNTIRHLIEDAIATDKTFRNHYAVASDPESYGITTKTLKALKNDTDPKTQALRDLANRWNINF